MDWRAEIFREAVASYRGQTLLLSLLAVAAGLMVVGEWWCRRDERVARAAFWTVLVAACGYGVFRAWQVKWLCDDAFITFRFSKNFAEGFGLVFNPGEWVEGYTNFLWALVLGVLGRVGADIPRAALSLNLASFVGVLLLSSMYVSRAAVASGAHRPVVPFSAVVLGGSAAMIDFATSGLETMPAAFLVMVGVWLARPGREAWKSGVAFVLAAMARPDHVLLAAAMGVALCLEEALMGPGRRRLAPWRTAVAFSVPFLAGFVPYWLVRWRVYGDFFPNTYYAKSGGVSYVEQGLVYATHFVCTTGFWAMLAALFVVAVLPVRVAAELRLRVFAVLSVLFLGGYVVRVGGDFMEWRFLVVLLPIVAVAVEVGARAFLAAVGPVRPVGRRVVLAGAALVSAVVALIPVQLIPDLQKRWHLAHEANYYPLESVYPIRDVATFWADGEMLAQVFPRGGVQPRVAAGSVGMLGYLSSVPIVDVYGIITRSIAHAPLTSRGRPGHERSTSVEQLAAEHVTLTMHDWWYGGHVPWVRADVLGRSVFFFRWDDATANAIRAAGGRVPDPQADIASAAAGTRDEALEALEFFEPFLERAPNKEEWLKPLRDRLAVVRVDLPPGLVAAQGPSRARWFSTTGTGRWAIPLGGVQTIRLRLGPSGSERLFVFLEVKTSDGWKRLDEKRPVKGAVQWVGWPRLQGAEEVRLTVVDEDPVGDLLWGDVHSASPEELTLLEKVASLRGDALVRLVRRWDDELEPESPVRAAWASRIERVDFDDGLPRDAVGEGTALSQTSVGTAANQMPVAGSLGAFLNSYAAGGDPAVGSLIIPLRARGDIVASVLVGGGADCGRLSVSLVVSGKTVDLACGQNDELLRGVLLHGHAAPADDVHLVVRDDATGPWGHIMVDQILVTSGG